MSVFYGVFVIRRCITLQHENHRYDEYDRKFVDNRMIDTYRRRLCFDECHHAGLWATDCG